MDTTYTTPPKKRVTSVGLTPDVRTWIDTNIPKRMRSKFVEDLIRQHIAATATQKVKRDTRAK